MELSIYTITSFLTLAAGALLLLQAARRPRRDPGVSVYLSLVGTLILACVTTIGMLAERAPLAQEDWGHLNGYLFYAGTIAATNMLVHFALIQRHGGSGVQRISGRALIALYLPATIMEGALFFTPLFVSGFLPGTSFHIPLVGPLYWLLKTYLLAGPVLALGLLVNGARTADTVNGRLRNALLAGGLFLSLTVFLLVGFTAYRLAHPSIMALWAPIVAVFLGIAARALFEPRQPDLLYYVPGSAHRCERIELYERLRASADAIAELRSPEEAVHRLALLFGAPVAIRASGGQLLTASPHGDTAMDVPKVILDKCRRLTVRSEIRTDWPAIYRGMVRYGIDAILPLYPYTGGAAGWLLLGEPFSRQIYSERDFREIQSLFERIAERVLDQLLTLHAEAKQQERTARELEGTCHVLEQENEFLRRENARLLRERPADSFSLISTASQEATVPPTLILLGRDKSLAQVLRLEFPQLVHYVGPASEGFRKQAPPDVLIIHVPERDPHLERQLLRLIRNDSHTTAFLLYGDGAKPLIEREHKHLLGHVVALLPPPLDRAALTAWIKATADLRSAALDITIPDHPLVGRSQVFIDLIADTVRASRFVDPVLIRGADHGEILALARFMHSRVSTGPFHILHANRLSQSHAGSGLCAEDERTLSAALRASHGGTLMIDHIETIGPTTLNRIVTRVLEVGDVRLIAGLESGDNAEPELPPSLKMLVLDIPSLVERRRDLPLLAHYYNLLFNLQAAGDGTLDGSELDALVQSDPVETQTALKALVFEQLGEQPQRPVRPAYLEPKEGTKTLEEHVAEFEIALIRRTLERCDGNKSQAARLLGLRPNTLHYKMVRHGLTGDRRKLDGDD